MMKKYYNVFTIGLTLVLILLFGAYLRYEDYYTWQQQKEIYTYKGAYQLTNSDSYHYLDIARDLSQGNYGVLNEKRWFPYSENRSAVPPLISVIAWLASLLSGLPLETVASFVSAILAPLLALVVYLWANELTTNKFASLNAAFFSVISLYYISRTRIGVFDTDCLNVTLLLLISYLFYKFGNKDNNSRYMYLITGLISVIFFVFWWDTAKAVVLMISLFMFAWELLYNYNKMKNSIKWSIITSCILVLVVLFYKDLASIFSIFFASSQDEIPFLGEVSELIPVSIEDFISKTAGNIFVFLLMLWGFIFLIWKQRTKLISLVIPILLSMAPFFSGNRFLIFAAPILGLGIAGFIEWLFGFKEKLKPVVVYSLTFIVVFSGIVFNYDSITQKASMPGLFNLTEVLKAVEEKTPQNAPILTDWGIGNEIMYTLNRPTFCDGEFHGRVDKLYYSSLPLASTELSFSANFINFYSNRSNGIEQLKTLFGNTKKTIDFLKKVLKEKSKDAQKIIDEMIANKQLPLNETLNNPNDWISFLYPKPKQPIYLLLEKHMIESVFWFKQGNLDLDTRKSEALPMYMLVRDIKEDGDVIKSSELSINKKDGLAVYMGQAKQNLANISTFDESKSDILNFPMPLPNQVDKRFVFEWYTPLNFGVVMSQDIAKTTFNKLYLQHQKSPYFKPIDLKTPYYQIWEVVGDFYTNE